MFYIRVYVGIGMADSEKQKSESLTWSGLQLAPTNVTRTRIYSYHHQR